MAKQDSFKKATEDAKSAVLRKAAEKVKPVNFMKEFNSRNMFEKGATVK